MTAMYIWVIVGLILVSAEILAGEFVLLMLGIGALATGLVVAFVDVGLPFQALLFGLFCLLLLVGLRPFLKRRMKVGNYKSYVEDLVGKPAVVIQEVASDRGQVQIAGDVWSARSADASIIANGQIAQIVAVRGAILTVSSVN